MLARLRPVIEVYLTTKAALRPGHETPRIWGSFLESASPVWKIEQRKIDMRRDDFSPFRGTAGRGAQTGNPGCARYCSAASRQLRRQSKFCFYAVYCMQIADVAFALSSPTRIAILKAARPNMMLGEIAEAVGIQPATLTYHLDVLEEAGLVQRDRSWNRTYLQLRFAEVHIPLR